MVFLCLAEIARAREPVQLEGLQIGRAGLGAFAAADAGHLGRGGREQGGAGDQHAVAGLGHRDVEGRHRHAHHRPTHDVAVGVGTRSGLDDQLVHRRADQGLEVARLRDIAGHRDQARDQRAAQIDRLMDRQRGAHIEALHAEIGGQRTMRHLDAGQHPDQLAHAAGRIAGRDRDHRAGFGLFGGRGLHRRDRLGLVVLDADQHLVGLQQMAHDRRATQDLGRAFAHQPVVAGDVGFALGAVQDQRAGRVFGARAQLDVGRKARSAHADDAGIAQPVAQFVRCQREGIDRLERRPALLAVGLDDHRQIGQPRGMRQHGGLDRTHHAGAGSVDRGREIAVWRGDALALQHLLTGLHQRTCGAAGALMQRHHQPRRQRGDPDRRFARQLLVAGRFDPAMEIEQLAQDAHALTPARSASGD